MEFFFAVANISCPGVDPNVLWMQITAFFGCPTDLVVTFVSEVSAIVPNVQQRKVEVQSKQLQLKTG
jgi:predicted Co/Zn/Cd cation transporter (cation efflux family)